MKEKNKKTERPKDKRRFLQRASEGQAMMERVFFLLVSRLVVWLVVVKNGV